MRTLFRPILFWCLAVAVVLLSGHWYVLPYAGALGAMLWVLHRYQRYREHSARERYDGIFLGFLWLVVAVRCRPFRWSAPVEQALNVAEHLGFALVIGLMAYLVFHLLLRWRAPKALLAALLAFNLLGVCNEFFQNAVNARPLLVLTPDAQKDIAMNAVGSLGLLLFLRPGRTDRPA